MKVHIGKYPKDYTKRKVKIQIDPWDTWNMDTTLALIIVPMLKQLKQTQQGAPQIDPLVDLEDAPEELRVDSKVHPYDEDGNYLKRWHYVLDEMIFAFESKLIDWEAQFLIKNPQQTNVDEQVYEYDWDAIKAYQKRMSNGFCLFGKYYEALWD